MKIIADARLPLLSQFFPPPFEVSVYHQAEELAQNAGQYEILLCRSTLPVDATLLSQHRFRYVATASSGTDHIDASELNARKIQLFDAKGSNAQAVVEYVLATWAVLQQARPLKVEKIGILGMGAVGEKLSQYLTFLGYSVISHDPLRALHDPDYHSYPLDNILACDLICVHANLHCDLPFPSQNLLNLSYLSQLQDNTVLINAARGGIVVEKDLLRLKNNILYCTDVYEQEPRISAEIVNFASIATPHIAGHSIEAKQNAVALLSTELHRAYGLIPPKVVETSSQSRVGLQKSTWMNQILSHYNPLAESQALKQAINKQTAFLSLRQAHHFRHDVFKIL